MAASSNDRRIPHLRDVFGLNGADFRNYENSSSSSSSGNSCSSSNNSSSDERYTDDRNSTINSGGKNKSKDKYKTLERHLSMKKTIRKKMMRDLQYIGVDNGEDGGNGNQDGILDKLRTDQPPTPNIEKPSLWKRLTKGWPGAGR